MQEAVEWMKDKIRSGERVIPYDAQKLGAGWLYAAGQAAE